MKLITLEKIEQLTRRGFRLTSGPETKLPNGRIITPVRLVRNGFRPIFGVTITEPDPDDMRELLAQKPPEAPADIELQPVPEV